LYSQNQGRLSRDVRIVTQEIIDREGLRNKPPLLVKWQLDGNTIYKEVVT